MNLAFAHVLAQNNDAAGGAAAAGAFSFICCCYAGVILFGLGMFALWLWMLIEVITKEPSEDPNKVMWILIVALLGGLGAIIYFFARRPERKRKYGR